MITHDFRAPVSMLTITGGVTFQDFSSLQSEPRVFKSSTLKSYLCYFTTEEHSDGTKPFLENFRGMIETDFWKTHPKKFHGFSFVRNRATSH